MKRHADRLQQPGYVRTYVVLPGLVYGIASNPLVESGIQNPHTLLISFLIEKSLDRGGAAMIGKGENIWGHVNIEERE